MNTEPDSSNQEVAPSSVSSAPTEPKYKGVGGWLLLFCISLTIFSPLVTLASLAGSWAYSKYFGQYPGLLFITVIDTILSIGVIGFGVYAGVALWRIRPGAVRLAKRFLITFLGYLAVSLILPLIAGLPSAATTATMTEVAKQAFRGVIYVAIWHEYLNKSQRVRATYPA